MLRNPGHTQGRHTSRVQTATFCLAESDLCWDFYQVATDSGMTRVPEAFGKAQRNPLVCGIDVFSVSPWRLGHLSNIPKVSPQSPLLAEVHLGGCFLVTVDSLLGGGFSFLFAGGCANHTFCCFLIKFLISMGFYNRKALVLGCRKKKNVRAANSSQNETIHNCLSGKAGVCAFHLFCIYRISHWRHE